MKFWILGFLLVFGASAQAEDFFEISVETMSSREEQSQAREVMLKDAIREVSERYIREMIGEGKLERNRSVIEGRILSNSDRFIPFIRHSQLEKREEGGWKSLVTLRISPKNLKQLLLKEGLLYLAEGTPVVVPFIEFVDRPRAARFRWWKTEEVEDQLLSNQAKAFHRNLRTKLNDGGFFLLEPVETKLSRIVPVPWRLESFQKKDLQYLGEFFGASVAIRGRVVKDHDDSPAGLGDIWRVTLEAVHTSNDRVVAEVSQAVSVRKSEDPLGDLAGDLSHQLIDVWQKGTLGAVIYRIVLEGSFTFRELERLKSETLNLSSVKRLVEREMSTGRVVLEADVTGESTALKEKLSRLKSVSLGLRGVGAQEMIFRRR